MPRIPPRRGGYVRPDAARMYVSPPAVIGALLSSPLELRLLRLDFAKYWRSCATEVADALELLKTLGLLGEEFVKAPSDSADVPNEFEEVAATLALFSSPPGSERSYVKARIGEMESLLMNGNLAAAF